MINLYAYDWDLKSYRNISAESINKIEVKLNNEKMLMVYIDLKEDVNCVLRFDFVDDNVADGNNFTMSAIDGSGLVTYDTMTITTRGRYRIPIPLAATEESCWVNVSCSGDVDVWIKSISYD